MADLITLSNLSPFIPNDQTQKAATQTILQELITVTSADFMRAINRLDFLTASYTEYRQGDGGTCMTLRHFPVTAVTTLNIAGVGISPIAQSQTGFFLDTSSDPERARQIYLMGTTFTDGALVTIAYTAGYTDAPEDVQGAVAEWVAFRYGGRSVAGMSKIQTADREDAQVATGSMPPNTLRVIEKYTKNLPALQRREQHADPPADQRDKR